jgi:hypothetical protein
LGKLLHFSPRTETATDPGTAPDLPDHRSAASDPLIEAFSNVFARMIASVENLNQIAHAIDHLRAQLPDGPFREQFEVRRLEVIAGVYSAKIRIEQIAESCRLLDEQRTDRDD